MPWRQVTAARQLVESERGAIVKDWGGQVPIVLAYPNSYAVGMSSLAIHGLYRWLNALPGIVCERAFASLDAHSPRNRDAHTSRNRDAHTPRSRDARAPGSGDTRTGRIQDRRKVAGEPLLTLETQRPVRDAAALAFSVSFEMDYFHIVSMLQRAEIPLRAEERGSNHPLVILGGPAVSANPQPLRALADAVVIGEVEPILSDLVNPLRASWERKRHDILQSLASVPGIYVPLVHDGRPVTRQVLHNLDDYPLASSVVAPRAEFGDMALIEIARGCGHGCRFCLAGYWYRPPRERCLESVLSQAREGLRHHRKVGLVAPAVSDYASIDELVLALRRMGAGISVSSLRVAPLSPVLVEALAAGGSRTITLAPEAGSERLWRRINKCVSREDCLTAVRLAASQPFEALKLYFMFGLPGETDEDIGELVSLVRETAGIFPRKVIANLTPFVPKAHTPFQRAAMAPEALLSERLERINAHLHGSGVEVRAEAVSEARVQGVLARGDDRVGEALLSMPRPVFSQFGRALEMQGLSVDEYLRERTPDEPLPWGFIDSRVGPAYLQVEARRAAEATVTAACSPDTCCRCGACPAKEKG